MNAIDVQDQRLENMENLVNMIETIAYLIRLGTYDQRMAPINLKVKVMGKCWGAEGYYVLRCPYLRQYAVIGIKFTSEGDSIMQSSRFLDYDNYIHLLIYNLYNIIFTFIIDQIPYFIQFTHF